MINSMIRWSRSIYFRIIVVVVIVIAFALAAVGVCISTVVDQEVGDFRQVFERARVMKLSQVLGNIIENGNISWAKYSLVASRDYGYRRKSG